MSTPAAREQRDDAAPGAVLVNLAFAGTGLFLAAVVLAVVFIDRLGTMLAAVCGGLFVVGSAEFLWAYAVGVVRSRYERIDLVGLFFLAGGAAPRDTAWRLRALLIAEIVIAGAAAAIRPFTETAFAVLVPLYGLGCMALWGARHGTFPPREP